eukprot:2109540-Lingulodinium_polyedra.AAC.1
MRSNAANRITRSTSVREGARVFANTVKKQHEGARAVPVSLDVAPALKGNCAGNGRAFEIIVNN